MKFGKNKKTMVVYGSFSWDFLKLEKLKWINCFEFREKKKKGKEKRDVNQFYIHRKNKTKKKKSNFPKSGCVICEGSAKKRSRLAGNDIIDKNNITQREDFIKRFNSKFYCIKMSQHGHLINYDINYSNYFFLYIATPTLLISFYFITQFSYYMYQFIDSVEPCPLGTQYPLVL